ncbi:MAG TPA: adenylate/guanylate cyclase domain-containing protein [Dehalococcoidia bacterium]|nr:adenylate/guanylate cyclase domain-containing protein [Dehalococcoidia bacterium]
MEPRIQYAKTSDGVNIAFWSLGEGRPLVIMPPSVSASHLELEWQWPEWRRWYERLAQRRKLVRYDGRGGGLSDRDAVDLSLDARLLDLEAVVDRLGLERFALLGAVNSGPTAVAYAARHPQRVSHLILWCTLARFLDLPPAVQALAELVDKDWVLYTEALAHHALGWSEADMARRFAAFVRECATPQTVQVVAEALRETDVTDLLPRVSSPTLVLHRRQIPFPLVDSARGLASGIPNARLVLLEGTNAMLWVDAEPVLAAIDEFLGEAEDAAPAEPAALGGFRTVLFTDVEGSTPLTQRLGDARARDVLREHERVTRECLREHGGSEVKTMGDGFMASFGSAVKALECAIAIQRAFDERNASLPARPEPALSEVEGALEGQAESQPSAHGSRASPRAGGDVGSASEALHVRIGLNAGEPIAEEADLFGTAVIRAARIAALAQGGEILVANVVRELAEGKGFLFGDRGEVALRGFDDPVRLFEVRWQP